MLRLDSFNAGRAMTPTDLQDMYSALRRISVFRGAPRTVLNPSESPTCRYCGKAAPDTTFRSDAHVLPELIGSRALLSGDECDRCNSFFAVTLEDSLGKFLGPARTLSQLPGKTGVPTHKQSDASVSLGSAGLEIHADSSTNVVSIDPDAKRIFFRLQRQPYTPIAVYKCFVKMAVGLLPATELPHFRDTIAWLREPATAHTNSIAAALNLAMGVVPGIHPMPGVVAFVFRRLQPQADVPYCLFLISFSNFLFQAVVPCRSQDGHLLGKDLSLTTFPTPFDHAWPHGAPQWQIVDCSATTPVRGDTFEWAIQCQELIDVTPPQR